MSQRIPMVQEADLTRIDGPGLVEPALLAELTRREVAAFVVCRTLVTEQDLLAHCRGSLAPYKIPRGIFILDQLPKSGLGKVLKSALVQRLPQLA